MKNKLILGLSLLALAGAAHASVTSKFYDFNLIELNGTGATAGTTVSLTVNGTATGSTTVASDGKYKFSVTGLSAGNVYKCVVSNGDTCDVVLGNGTGVLFGASAKSGSDVPTNGTWDPAYPTPDVTDKAYVLAGTSNKFNVATESRPSGKIVYIDSEMTFSDGADELEPFEALGAFTLAQTNETDDADFFWAGLVKEGGVAKWIALVADGVEPNSGTFTSRMEFDFNSTPAKVRYWIKSGLEAFVVLKNGSTEWFEVAKTAAENVASVSFEGTGKFAAFEGSSFDTDVAQVGLTKYATIAKALTDNKGGTVTLLTNTRPAANEALSGSNWTITENGNSFEPYETTGYTFTYEGTAFAVMPYQTSVNVAGSTAMGYDFTNGTVNVAITGSHIQSGTSVSATVTVKNAAGTETIATQTFTDITGDTNLVLKVADPLTRLGDYKYEVVIKKGDNTIKTVSDTFVAGNDANWFSADQSNWANNGSWSTNRVAVQIAPATEKIELGGNQYDFTPTAPDISNVIVRVDTVIELNGAIDSEDLPTEGNVQGMIALVETDGETPAWQAYVGSTWKTLTGGDTEVGTYTIRAEFDYRGTAKTVRYSVAKDGGAFAVLKDNGTEWLANGKTDVATLEGTSAMGAGSLVSLKGDNIDASVAEVDGVRYETMAAALAAADGKNVTLLWNCTWTPGVNGQWMIDDNGMTLIVYGADGWDFDYENDELQASNVKVAKVGDNEYYLIKKAFAAVPAEGDTVEMLTNLVQSVDVAVEDNAILDLAGWFVSGNGALAVAENKSLVFTNSTAAVGGFGMAGVADAGAKYSICGGKWVDNDNTGTLGTNYKFIKLAEEPTVDGVTYKYEAMFTTIEDPTTAKVYPVKDGDNSVGDAVVTDDFVKQHLPDITDPAAIATALNENRTTGNCLPLIQSYILGLDPDSETAKPIVGAVQNADADKVTLSRGALAVNTAAGVPVQFSLSTAAAADFSGATESAKQDSSEFNVDIGAAKLQYYKIKIYFGK